MLLVWIITIHQEKTAEWSDSCKVLNVLQTIATVSLHLSPRSALGNDATTTPWHPSLRFLAAPRRPWPGLELSADTSDTSPLYTLCIKITSSTHGSYASISGGLCIESYCKNTPCTIRHKASTRISIKTFHWIPLVLNFSSICLVSHDSYQFNLVEIILRSKRCQHQLQWSKRNPEEPPIREEAPSSFSAWYTSEPPSLQHAASCGMPASRFPAFGTQYVRGEGCWEKVKMEMI